MLPAQDREQNPTRSSNNHRKGLPYKEEELEEAGQPLQTRPHEGPASGLRLPFQPAGGALQAPAGNVGVRGGQQSGLNSSQPALWALPRGHTVPCDGHTGTRSGRLPGRLRPAPPGQRGLSSSETPCASDTTASASRGQGALGGRGCTGPSAICTWRPQPGGGKRDF